jgi:hypothetical protein
MKRKVKVGGSPLIRYSSFVLVLSAGIFIGNFLTSLSAKQSVLGQETTGFDKFGYNYNARIFNGKADGVDKVLDGKVWGDPAYANDRLVMKWSKAWDDARFRGQSWTPDAWEDNEWNGKLSGGSGEVWHYKIVWVGKELQNSPYWKEGGSPIWGEFEVIFSQGSVANEHFWDIHAKSPGYGAK